MHVFSSTAVKTQISFEDCPTLKTGVLTVALQRGLVFQNPALVNQPLLLNRTPALLHQRSLELCHIPIRLHIDVKRSACRHPNADGNCLQRARKGEEERWSESMAWKEEERGRGPQGFKGKEASTAGHVIYSSTILRIWEGEERGNTGVWCGARP